MKPIWYTPDLAEEIIKNDDVFEQTHGIVTDIVLGRFDLATLTENMAGVLINKNAESRERGMKFFTKVLKEIPKEYLTEMQVKFISKFYVDRLKDNHRVIPSVLEGYLTLIEMKNYKVECSGEFFTVLFREVGCQSQVRQDRYNIYLIIQHILDMDAQYVKFLGPDFVYGFISAMDGERDPRNLLFLFNLLLKFLSKIPLGHLVEEMFEVISCYFPIDFHPSPNDPAAVSRNDLAAALSPCLYAIPEFGEHCLLLLIEKLDSNLRVAKMDSLNLLIESYQTFKPDSYHPFLKTLWSSLQREISYKVDEDLQLTSLKALYGLIVKLSTSDSDQVFESFIKGILISMQTAIAEATKVIQFVLAAKTMLTVANATKQSCEIIAKPMIPAIIAYYEFKTSPKLQIASLNFLGDLHNVIVHWRIEELLREQVREIPQLCLNAVSVPSKEYQVAGFKTLTRVMSSLEMDLVLPFVEILIYNIQHNEDDELLGISVETVHEIARRYPELVMSIVVQGKCDLSNLTRDKTALEKRLNLLSSLASIDDFTKVIIEEMLKAISTDNEEASKVVKALNSSISNITLYSEHKVAQIESDHGLIESILIWLLKEIKVTTATQESLDNGFALVANTISSLPSEKQLKILSRHTNELLEKCKTDDAYFQVLECLYRSLNQDVYNTHFLEIMTVSLNLALNSESDAVRLKGCYLVADFLNKTESGQQFEVMYEILKNYLTSCDRDDVNLCPRLISLYGWITKALVLRGSDLFNFWLNKIVISISKSECSNIGSESIRVIVTDHPSCLNPRHHCRSSLLYRQRIFQAFTSMSEKCGPPRRDKEPYYLSWAYVLEKTPKSLLNSAVDKIVPLCIDALEYDNKDLLLIMIDLLTQFLKEKSSIATHSIQPILQRILNLITYKSMDVRINSLLCIYEVANSCATWQLLPHKQEVLLALAPALDDRKRLARHAAVKARTRWFLVGAPGEDLDNRQS